MLWPATWTAFPTNLALTLVFSSLSNFAIERPFQALRERLEYKFVRPRSGTLPEPDLVKAGTLD